MRAACTFFKTNAHCTQKGEKKAPANCRSLPVFVDTARKSDYDAIPQTLSQLVGSPEAAIPRGESRR